jgi:Ser/Thr protein kinase RdoA (MazF antagonist)
VTELASPADQTLLALASRLLDSAGRGGANALSRLDGGKNNQVYRVATDAGDAVVLKHYFSDPRDPRDRLAAEWGFLKHTWSCGVRAVPEPLASDATARAGLYGFVPGRKLLATELKPQHIDAAIDFVLAVNAAPRSQEALPAASEACFSLADHIATVERRVARLATLDPDAPHVQDAQRLVDGALLPEWTAVKARLTKDAHDAGLAIGRALRPDQCCLSPSDFGFHNALADEAGRVTFLDFEYAGRDDPAKLVSDFFCQPEIQVPLSYYPGFLTRLADRLELDEAGRARCRILLDAYRVKWSCIILNDFLPVGAARRSFADAGAWDIRCQKQIKKAEAKIGEILA